MRSRTKAQANPLVACRLTEIQKAIEELAPDENEQLRDRLDGYDPAVEREWAGIAQERLRQIESLAHPVLADRGAQVAAG
jgi:hypothetical protein